MIREAGGSYHVVKNKLAAKSSEGTKVEAALQGLKGVSSVAYTSGDPVALAKALSTWVKDNAEFTFKLGIVDGKVITVAEIDSLAKLPGKEELFSKLLFLIQSPAQRLATVINATGRNLAVVVNHGRRAGQVRRTGGEGCGSGTGCRSSGGRSSGSRSGRGACRRGSGRRAAFGRSRAGERRRRRRLAKRRRPSRPRDNQVSSQSSAGAQSGRNGNLSKGRQPEAEEGFRELNQQISSTNFEICSTRRESWRICSSWKIRSLASACLRRRSW